MITSMHIEDDEGVLCATFSGVAPIASAQQFTDAQAGSCGRLFAAIADLRHQAALSGAMRWPWSQEAFINSYWEVRL